LDWTLFFYPDSLNHRGHPKNQGYRFKTIKICSTDSVVLDGWFVFSKSETAKATIVYFHGNAANITNHWDFVDWVPEMGFDLLCFDYRGYGKSTGKPSFEGVFNDCCAVIDFVRKDSIVRNRSFIILGQSLGGAFSISATAEKLSEDISGMVLDSTFNSFREIAALKAPSLLGQVARILITDRFDPKNFIHKLKVPKIFINSTDDPVVPYELGYKLYELAPKPKKFITLSSPRHLSLFSIQRNSRQWESVISFLNDLSS
jgi:uncharacterized protein